MGFRKTFQLHYQGTVLRHSLIGTKWAFKANIVSLITAKAWFSNALPWSDPYLRIELSQLYSMIEVYKQTAYSFIGSNMDLAATATALGRSVDNERFSENFLGFFQMLVQIEAALIEAHQNAIASIDQAQKG
jgi:hypothetical protein